MARSGPLTFHVTPEDGVWCLWLLGAPNTAQHFARKEDAVRLGVQHASATPPSRLLVFDGDGEVILTRQFDHRTAEPRSVGSEYALGRGAVSREEI